MPFPPINLHQRISSSPGRELFRRKKAPQPELLKQAKPSGEEEIKHFSEKLSASWTSANFRNLGRKPQQHKTKPSATNTTTTATTTTTTTTTRGLVAAGQEARRGGANPWLTVPKPQDSSCDALAALSSSMEESSASRRSSRQSSSRGGSLLLGMKDPSPSPDIQFTLSLTPEAILVIQKRNLEKQRTASNKQQKTTCCSGSAPGGAGGDFRHRRVFPSSSSAKKTHGGGGAQHRSGIPVASSNKQPSGEEQQDITAIVKISLLNDQYKYDDVEYEEEDGDVDETVVRKCKEWLKGVESAAAFGKAEKLCAALPHVKGC